MMKLDALCSNVARDEMKTAMAAYRTGAAESAQMFKRGIARVTPLKINGTICCYRHIACNMMPSLAPCTATTA